MAHHPGTGGLRYVAVLGLAAAVTWSTVLPGRLSRPVVEAVSPVRIPAPAAVAPANVDAPAATPATAAPAPARRPAPRQPAPQAAHTHDPTLAAASAAPPAAVSPPPAAVTAPPAPPPAPPVSIAQVVDTIGQAVDGSKRAARPRGERAAPPPRPRPEPEHERPERARPAPRPPQLPAVADDHPGLGGRTPDDRRAARD